MANSKTQTPTKSKTPEKGSKSPAKQMAAAKEPKAKRRHPNRGLSFAPYVHRMLKSGAEKEMSVSKKAMAVLDSMIHDILRRLATEAGQLVRHDKRSTMSMRDIKSAAHLQLTGQVKNMALHVSMEAVAKYRSAAEAHTKGDKKRSRSAAAGLMFPVGRVITALKKGGYARRVSVLAGVGLTAVLQYVAQEVMELACTAAHGQLGPHEKSASYKHKRVNPRDVFLAIHSDEEIYALVGTAIISSGGAEQYIHHALQPEKKVRREAKAPKATKAKKAPKAALTAEAAEKEVGKVAAEVAKIEHKIHATGGREKKRASSHKKRAGSQKKAGSHKKRASKKA